MHASNATRAALASALRRDPKLPTRRFRDIHSAAVSAYYRALRSEIGSRLIARAVRLYSLYRPDCVTEEGREQGLIECDYCAEALPDMVERYLFDYWIPRHPEWEWQELTEAEARAVLAELGAEAERERLDREDYQMALF